MYLNLSKMSNIIKNQDVFWHAFAYTKVDAVLMLPLLCLILLNSHCFWRLFCIMEDSFEKLISPCNCFHSCQGADMQMVKILSMFQHISSLKVSFMELLQFASSYYNEYQMGILILFHIMLNSYSLSIDFHMSHIEPLMFSIIKYKNHQLLCLEHKPNTERFVLFSPVSQCAKKNSYQPFK